MGTHVILGAGAIGRGAARELASAGHHVLLVSRSGGGSDLQGVEVVAADVTDGARVAQVATGADSIVDALNPSQYSTWAELWPPMASAILAAASATGAGLVTVGNLYPYGRVAAPMTEETPVAPNGRKGEVRAAMWRDALTLHQDGRIRATEVRGSDYVGAGMGAQSYLNSFVVKPAMAGRSGWLVMGDPDAPHTWTNGQDVARLVAGLASEPADSPAWGRTWHVPSAPPRSMAQVAEEVAVLVGQPVRRPRRVPKPLVSAVGSVYPLLREFNETRHQFEAPFVLDSTAASTAFGLAATPWESTLRESVAWLSETAA
ncbi:MAG: NAD-dependent epimerase/dehydratase family protein [Ornithinibacter sp.]